MQVYFVASSRLVGKDVTLYKRMYEVLADGNKMVSDKVLKLIKSGIRDLKNESLKFKRSNYEESIKSLKKAELVVIEVSGHSMSAGYLIAQALEMNKPVIALHKAESKPIFIGGIVDQKLFLVEYNNENVEEVIKTTLKKVAALVDVRFNFFVSPKILTYLDWITQKRMIPKSVFLRNLIEREMKKEKDFK